MTARNPLALIATLPIISYLLKQLRQSQTTQESEQKPEPNKEGAKVGASDKADPSEHLRDGLEKIRTDLAAFGTAVGVAAGSITIVTMFGTFDDLFPLPIAYQWILGIAALFFAVAAVCSVRLTQLFFSARRRIVVETSILDPWQEDDPRNADLKTAGEHTFLEQPLKAFAMGEGATSAHELELRRDRLQRVAARSTEIGDTDAAERARSEANRLTQGIQVAFLSGALQLLEKRSIEVYRGWRTVALAAAVALGAGGLFFVADWSRGERDRITSFNTCTKEATDKSICNQLWPTPTPPPSSGGSTAQDASSPSTKVLHDLNTCAGIAPSPGVPRQLRNSALAACAGLPAPAPASTP